MTRLGPLLAAAAFALSASPALAQPYNDEEIVVPGPTVERHHTGRRTSIGAPIDELTLQRVISTRDLDLRRNADVSELHRRIHIVARDSCHDLERASRGVLLTTQRQCVRAAVRDAMVQADALIYAARG